jgi:hypothetical protein
MRIVLNDHEILEVVHSSNKKRVEIQFRHDFENELIAEVDVTDIDEDTVIGAATFWTETFYINNKHIMAHLGKKDNLVWLIGYVGDAEPKEIIAHLLGES